MLEWSTRSISYISNDEKDSFQILSKAEGLYNNAKDSRSKYLFLRHSVKKRVFEVINSFTPSPLCLDSWAKKT